MDSSKLALEEADAGLAIAQLKAMLEAMPPGTASANDLHLRDMAEAFIAGWELGSRPGQERCTSGVENVGTLTDTQEETCGTIGG